MTFSNPARQRGGRRRRLRAGAARGPRRPRAARGAGRARAWLDARLRGRAATPTLRRPEAPGKWSATEVVQHLADSELVLGFRMRMILTEDRPALQGYDQDRWAGTLRYARCLSTRP